MEALKVYREKASRWREAALANPFFRNGMIGAAVIVLLDQLTKFLIVDVVRLPERFGGKIEISPFFDLTYVQNKGASFGMLAGGPGARLLLSAISLGVSIALLVWLARIVRPLVAAGVAFIIGGALGNFIDRVTLGYVVDFLDFSGLYFPWVFNVADAAINVGIALFILDAIREAREKKAGAP
jgi:signal peptidase II